MNRILSLALLLCPALLCSALDRAPSKPASHSGVVAETMNSGGYTYVRLKEGKSSVWVAVPPMKVKVGQRLTLEAGMEMRDFFSKTLKRTFPVLFLSNGPMSEAAGSANPHQQVAEAHSSKAMPPETDIKIEKAAGGVTVEELYRRNKELDGKQVLVRGKVVRISPKIMGRNWIHLQDGTGDQGKGTHDLTLTMPDIPVIGEVVVIKGAARKDKDFGSGYRYSIIVEDAAIVK